MYLVNFEYFFLHIFIKKDDITSKVGQLKDDPRNPDIMVHIYSCTLADLNLNILKKKSITGKICIRDPEIIRFRKGSRKKVRFLVVTIFFSDIIFSSLVVRPLPSRS